MNSEGGCRGRARATHHSGPSASAGTAYRASRLSRGLESLHQGQPTWGHCWHRPAGMAPLMLKSPKTRQAVGTWALGAPARGEGVGWYLRAHCESSPSRVPSHGSSFLQQPPHLRIRLRVPMSAAVRGLPRPEPASLGSRRVCPDVISPRDSGRPRTVPATPGFLFLEPCALSHGLQQGLGARPHYKDWEGPTVFILQWV